MVADNRPADGRVACLVMYRPAAMSRLVGRPAVTGRVGGMALARFLIMRISSSTCASTVLTAGDGTRGVVPRRTYSRRSILFGIRRTGRKLSKVWMERWMDETVAFFLWKKKREFYWDFAVQTVIVVEMYPRGTPYA